jgi:hypothetical protein
MTNDLIERIPQLLAKLRKRYGHLQWPGGRLENPDGPEAAAHIEALAERVRELEEETHSAWFAGYEAAQRGQARKDKEND